MNISLNLDKFFTHLKPFTGNFCDIAYPYKLLASKYVRYDDVTSLLFFINLLFALAYLCVAWQIPLLVPISTINSISISANNSNYSFVFFKHACHDNPGENKK